LDDLRFTAAEWRHRATAAWENWLISWENRTLAQRTRSAAILLFAGGAVAAAWFIGRTDPVTFTVEMSADSPTTVSVAGTSIVATTATERAPDSTAPVPPDTAAIPVGTEATVVETTLAQGTGVDTPVGPADNTDKKSPRTTVPKRFTFPFGGAAFTGAPSTVAPRAAETPAPAAPAAPSAPGISPAAPPPATAPVPTRPPATSPPATTPPTTRPTTTRPPVTVPPTTRPPVTVPPTTRPPVTIPPTTAPPATSPPTTDPPVTEPPVTAPPTTQAPTIEDVLNGLFT